MVTTMRTIASAGSCPRLWHAQSANPPDDGEAPSGSHNREADCGDEFEQSVPELPGSPMRPFAEGLGPVTLVQTTSTHSAQDGEALSRASSGDLIASFDARIAASRTSESSRLDRVSVDHGASRAPQVGATSLAEVEQNHSIAVGVGEASGIALAVTAADATVATEEDPSVAALLTAADGFVDVVYGVPTTNSGLTKLVRRVILLAAVGATFYVVNFVVNLLRGQYTHLAAASLWTAMSTLLIELSVPACGYYGARHNNRQLACCFCSCNLFITIVTIMTLVKLELRIGEIDGNCQLEQNEQERRTCEVWTTAGLEKGVMVSSMLVTIILGCVAFWVGNTLYRRLAHDLASSVSAPSPLVGEVVRMPLTPGRTVSPVLLQQIVASDDPSANPLVGRLQAYPPPGTASGPTD